jgi:hypothetical protein
VSAMARTPSGPVGPHLGERVSAFVDETLAEDARDRALVHIAGCGLCRDEVESSRLLKIRLSVLPAPQVSAALTARLLAMAEPGGPIPPRPGQLPGQPRAVNVPARPAAGRPQGSRPAGRNNRDSTHSARRTVRLAALAGAALSTMVVTVVGLSGAVGTDTAPKPPVSQLTSNVGGVSDPMLEVSRILRKAPASAAFVATP